MGMFDTVRGFECECPFCHVLVIGFQSKDGPCEFGEVAVSEVETFMSICHGCKAALRFSRIVSDAPTHVLHAAKYGSEPKDLCYRIVEDHINTVIYKTERC